MQQRKRTQIGIGVGVLVLVVLGLLAVVPHFIHRQTQTGTPLTQTVSTLVTDLGSVPEDVRQAAMVLKGSRVGYAIEKGSQTFLVISNGSSGNPVALVNAEGTPGTGFPTHVDVNLKSDSAGNRLLIARTPLTGPVIYHFGLDRVHAAIPTLFNPDNVPLVPLDEAAGIAVVPPSAKGIDKGVIHVAGFARLAGGRLTVSVTTAKGRVLGKRSITAAAEYPHWGSFTADVVIDTQDLPDSGFVMFEAESGAHVAVPIMFHRPAQLG